MKNKFLVGVVTFFTAIILSVIVLNIFDSSTKKDYFFDRKFVAESPLKFDKKFEKMNSSEYIMYIPSDYSLVERDKMVIDAEKAEYKFYFSDLVFTKIVTKTAILPNFCSIILYDKNRLFYIVKFQLFVYDFETKKSKKIGSNNFKAFSLKVIPNSKTKFLCFGESFENSSYNTGFHIIDIDTNEIFSTKILQNNDQSEMTKNCLIYSGNFTKTYDKNIIAYACDKYSKIYFFDSNGLFTKELNTNDNVPLPDILTNQKGYNFYSRGGTWATNVGMFMKDGDIFVFSARSDDNNTIIIDQYSYYTLQYVQSYKLNYNNLNSKRIMNVFIDKDKIILVFEFNYASFTFSRYIR
ncbi:hypothetical protein [Flavobacterium sp. LS1R10]|uniref:hypothetical protein n=1 Tax=Flavobacterium sp. LS1R10 TaxID=2497482 RepID=UPI000F81B4D3|nr:hypothetical protein [Flavobacterium sp. LS1R10]